MSIEVINTGTSPNSGNGDTLRSAFIKVNNNFSYLQSSLTNISIAQGPTGPSSINGLIESSISGNIAYYSTAGTTLAGTNLLRVDIENNQIIFGNGSQIRIIQNEYTPNLSKITLSEYHEVSDVNNIVFFRARGDSNSPLPTNVGDDIADISFNTINSQNTNTSIANISVIVVDTSTIYPTGILSISLNQGNTKNPVELLRLTPDGTLRSNFLGALTQESSLQVRNNLVPATDSTYDLGSTSSQWNNLFLNNSLQFSDNTTQTTAYNLLDVIPESSTSTGIKGQMAVSTTSLYVCVATNSWLKFDGTTF